MSELCTICGAEFGSASDLMVHMKTDHKDADPASDVEMNPEAHTKGFLCALCGRRFPTAEALAAHNLHPHSIGRPARQPALVESY
jgi:C2H2-type zinc finger